MELSQLIEQLNNTDKFPKAVIKELIARKEESTPALLEVVKKTLQDYKRVAEESDNYIFAVHILSQFNEPQAFPYTIKLALLPADWLNRLLDTFITEGLACWMVSTYNGDLQAIKNVAENEAAYTFARFAALDALVGLVAINKLSREDLLAYLKILIYSDLVKDYEFATWVVSTVTDLYPTELYEDMMGLFDKNLIDTTIINKDFIENTIEMGKEKCLEKYVYSNDNRLPITDVLQRLAWMEKCI